MKAAVIGNGNVGMATFQALMTMNEITEIALVGRNVSKIKAEITDYRDFMALRPDFRCKLYGGGYELTRGADIIVYTAGTPRQPGQSRLDLLIENAKVVENIFSQIDQYNKDAYIIVVSNPVDVITTLIQKNTGRPASKVIGTGTLLDSARLRRILADILDVSLHSVIFNVVGEHGNSSCLLWSGVNVAGMRLDDFLEVSGSECIVLNKEMLHTAVASAGGKLIKDKGNTSYGVAAAVAHVVSAIINDSRELMPVSTVLNGQYGIEGIAISVPCIVGKAGAEVMKVYMTDEEREKFEASAQILKDAYANVSQRE